MPVGLNHTQAVAYKGNLYVFGGHTGEGQANTLYRYRPGARSLEAAAQRANRPRRPMRSA